MASNGAFAFSARIVASSTRLPANALRPLTGTPMLRSESMYPVYPCFRFEGQKRGSGQGPTSAIPAD